MAALDQVASWRVPNVAAAVVAADGAVVAVHGDPDRPFRLASVTKVIVGWTAMIAVEEGVISLDDAAGQPGCSIRHLLAHAGGYAFDGANPITEPGRQRIYSNTGYDALAAAVEARVGRPFAVLMREWVLEPLGMTGARFAGKPSQGLVGTLRDLQALAFELLSPRLVIAHTAASASVAR